MSEPVPPVFYFHGTTFDFEESFEEFDDGLENIDVENGEYDRVFDSVGGQWHFEACVSRDPQPEGWWPRLKWRIAGPSEWVKVTYTPPTAASRERFAAELCQAMGIATVDAMNLNGLVESEIQRKRAVRTERAKRKR